MAEKSEESATAASPDELKRERRKKLLLYIAIFAVFQVIVIAVFVLVVLKARSPKLRLGDIEVQNLVTGTDTSPTFDATFGAEVRVKNPNFGPYKFETTLVSFTYEGIVVGQVVVQEGKVGMKSTKEIDVIVSVSSRYLGGFGTNNLASELGVGFLTLRGNAVMRGKVELLGIVKKNKAAQMSCFITFDLASKMVRNLDCE
ncbi:hypothetical protein TIFTF001_003435 [Ficus carica]|uniref:Late embryogenesis abundant protein LEA-2 subgroup domain-containing protein n=1 Tax=Ficus carica TaxID=3494 RepID=A0AA87ZHF1_FICCA|nr:hypothetical protein TIFTF001_003435 [Ficus carica]